MKTKNKKKKSKLGSGTVITNQSGEHLGCPKGCTFSHVEVDYEIQGSGSISVECEEETDFEDAFEYIDEIDLAQEIIWDYGGEKKITDIPRCGECKETLQIIKNNSIRLIKELAEKEEDGKHGK